MLDEAGHIPGMLGLYEPEKKILFCGDHILGKITPNITYWGEKYGDSLGTYLKNIEKLKSLEIKYLFSSHRFLVEDINGRIEELKVHHQKRLIPKLFLKTVLFYILYLKTLHFFRLKFEVPFQQIGRAHV